MAIRFEWSDDYSVGVKELDDQHRHIFDLGNKIQEADRSMARKFVMELYKYIRTHFVIEEKHMMTLGFPLIYEHREKHEQLITDFNELTQGFEREDFEALSAFLHSWLVKHVLLEDKKYFVFARNDIDRNL